MFARRREVLEREAERIGALAVQGDLTIPQHLERLVQATVGAFGGIDVLVLNGGGPPAGTAASLTADVGRGGRRAPAHVARHARRALPPPPSRRAAAGASSRSSRRPCASRIAELALSNAVRPGVVGWLKTLARELGPDGITVNTIAPGRIDTERLRELLRRRWPPGRRRSSRSRPAPRHARRDRRGRRLPRLRPRRRTSPAR